MPSPTIAKLLADEIAAHGTVRPPWMVLPDTHPMEIAWRMGEGETHLMLWHTWAEGRAAEEIVAAIKARGAVPADWAPWAAEAAGLVAEGEDVDELSFEDVRGRLARVGVGVEGEPSEEG